MFYTKHLIKWALLWSADFTQLWDVWISKTTTIQTKVTSIQNLKTFPTQPHIVWLRCSLRGQGRNVKRFVKEIGHSHPEVVNLDGVIVSESEEIQV